MNDNNVVPWTPEPRFELGSRRKERSLEERMAAGAAEMMLQCVSIASISMQDMNIKRRPYHRYCTCALHSLKVGCSKTFPEYRSITFPQKEWQKYCSLSVGVSMLSSHACSISQSNDRNRGTSSESFPGR